MSANEEPMPSLILSITPEPTTDERDAIVAALVILRSRHVAASAPIRSAPTRWQRTARQEGVRAGGVDQGWS